MAIYKVKKRNGAIVSFDRSKIEKVIKRAIESVGGTDYSKIEHMTNIVIEIVIEKVGNEIPDVEIIQDAVEQVLIKEGHDTVAKAFILYRQKRSESREAKKVVVEVGKTMDEYLQQTDWRVNANSNQ